MKNVKYKKIEWIQGRKRGSFPFCNTLFINDRVKVVIDPGAGPEKLTRILEEARIDIVINTHFHFDHIAYNHLFRGAKIYINEIEGECFLDRRNILKRLGITEFYGEDFACGWFERISRPDSVQSPHSPQNRHEWMLSTARLDGTYRWGDTMDFGATRMKIIGMPGHTEGNCCLHFPDQGILYTGDVDLTAFGPSYFTPDADPDIFIDSAKKMAEIDADTYITSHEAGILNRSDFMARLDQYLGIIDRRDENILNALSKPLDLAGIQSLGLIYRKKYLIDEWVRVWNAHATKQHLNRLLKKGLLECRNGLYVRKF